MIWCAGREGTCARLTWDDTDRFITMGSPGDQKTHLKGVFQGINCLTWLTQVWETFRMAIKGPVERQNRAVAKRWLSVYQAVRYFSQNHMPLADKVTVIELANPFYSSLSWCVWFCTQVGVISHDLRLLPESGGFNPSTWYHIWCHK